MRSGDVIAEIETDKATMEVEARRGRGDRQAAASPKAPSMSRSTSPSPLLVTEDDDGASSFETRPVAAPQDEEQRLTPRLAPHPEEGAAAPVSKGEGPLAPSRSCTSIAEQIRRNGGERSRDAHVRLAAGAAARARARDRASRRCKARARTDASSRRTSSARPTLTPKAAAHRTESSKPAAAEAIDERAGAEAAPARAGRAERAAREPRGLSDAQGARALRAGLLRDRAARHDASLHRRAADARRSRPSRISISPSIASSTRCWPPARGSTRSPRRRARAPSSSRSTISSSRRWPWRCKRCRAPTPPGRTQGILRHRASDIAVAVALEGGGLHTPGDPRRRGQEPVGDLQRDARSRRARALEAPRAARISGRLDHHLQSRHVRHRPLRCGDQPAAGLDHGGRPRREAPGGQGRRAEDRHHDERHALGRSPRDRRRARRRAARRLQGLSSKTP